MRKSVTSCLLALSLCANAQVYTNNSVFPIINTVTSEPEFVVASITQSYEYMGRDVCLSDIMYIRMGEQPAYTAKWGSDLGSFISFSYVTKQLSPTTNEWNSGSETMQFAFHPGGLAGANYSDSSSPMTVPLYAFTYSEEKGLNLIDLETMKVVAKLGDGGQPTKYTYLTVFAGKGRTAKDIIVVAGKDKFDIYGTFADNGSSGVRKIFSSASAPSYFDINGQRLDAPKQGINIVFDGNETKKIVVK